MEECDPQRDFFEGKGANFASFKDGGEKKREKRMTRRHKDQTLLVPIKETAGCRVSISRRGRGKV